ncbi:MAG: hypothetical protein D6748_09015 [Calditrichaeota bacterium]|nr:MAG: hypothetical protein D6748_09015 [Calditrichota bacterium]
MKRCHLFLVVFMLLSLSFLMELMAQAPYTIQLKSRKFLPPVDQQTAFEAIRQQGISPEATLSGSYHVLLQFYEIPDELQKNRLKATGIVLHDYIPHRAFSASIAPTVTPNDLVALGVRFVGLFQPTDKLSPELLEGYPQTRSKSPDRLAVYVLTYPDIPISAAVSILIRKFDCEILSSSEQFHLISLILLKNQLNELASLE